MPHAADFSRRHALAGLVLLGAAACRSRAMAEGETAAARPDLYACEGCEGLAERNPDYLTASARMAPKGEPGEPLVVTGRVLSEDTRTPVAGIVIYAYHTDAQGLYSRGSSETEWSRRHGKLRGWVRTGADGRYEFATIKPAPYPRQTMPAHVHLTVGEPGRRLYYIDDVVFAGEFGVTDAYRARQELRGGSGIVTLGRTPEGRLLAVRDIILERHPQPA